MTDHLALKEKSAVAKTANAETGTEKSAAKDSITMGIKRIKIGLGKNYYRKK